NERSFMSARTWLTAVSILVAVPAAAQSPQAQVPPPAAQVQVTPPDFPRGKISGYMFGDWYYDLAGDPTHHYNAAGQDSDKVNIDNSAAQQIGKDLNGFQFRRVYFQLDNGLSVKGFADNDHRLGYSAMIGNGVGQKPEDNRYKKFMVALPIHVGDLRVEPFADYENGAGGTDRATYKAFAGYELKRSAIGVEV